MQQCLRSKKLLKDCFANPKAMLKNYLVHGKIVLGEITLYEMALGEI
jgi:hypothetical protein